MRRTDQAHQSNPHGTLASTVTSKAVAALMADRWRTGAAENTDGDVPGHRQTTTVLAIPLRTQPYYQLKETGLYSSLSMTTTAGGQNMPVN